MAVDKLASKDLKREVEGAEGRSVVTFYADWCGPCRQVAPALEELSSKWDSEIRFVKDNIDESVQLAETYRIFPIPTTMLFENGAVAAQTVGARSASFIERALGLDNGHIHTSPTSTPISARHQVVS